jgi:hypothetical protein
MKTVSLLLLVAGSLLLTACEVAVVKRHPVTTRRSISYRDREPDHRVYYRGERGRPYYRRHYYDDDATYRTRIDTRRYYSRPGPVDRTYGF